MIGRSSVPLCIDALKAAVAEAKKGKDVHRYREAWECIRVAAPGEPEAHFDTAWAEATERSNKAETHRLEMELRGYKNNLVKESIRVSVVPRGGHRSHAYARRRCSLSDRVLVIDGQRGLGSSSRRDW